MTNFGYTMMTEQSPPDQLVRDLQMAEQAGFDFSVISDHFQPWLDEQGHCRLRLVDPRCRGPGHRADRPDDLRDLSDPALSPGDRGPEGGHDGDPVRQPLPPRAGGGGEPQRARGRQGLAGGRGPARDARAKRSTSSPRCSTPSSGSTTAAATSRSSRPSSGTGRPSAFPIGLAVSGASSCALAGHKADLMIAVEPEARAGGDVRRRRRVGQAPSGPDRPVLRLRPRRRPSSAPTRSSAGSGWAGRSTPTFPTRSRFDARHPVRDARIRWPTRWAVGPTSSEHVEKIKPFIEAGFTEIALVQIGADQQAGVHDLGRAGALAGPPGALTSAPPERGGDLRGHRRGPATAQRDRVVVDVGDLDGAAPGSDLRRPRPRPARAAASGWASPTSPRGAHTRTAGSRSRLGGGGLEHVAAVRRDAVGVDRRAQSLPPGQSGRNWHKRLDPAGPRRPGHRGMR